MVAGRPPAWKLCHKARQAPPRSDHLSTAFRSVAASQAVNLRANQFTRFPTQLKVARHTAQELHLVRA